MSCLFGKRPKPSMNKIDMSHHNSLTKMESNVMKIAKKYEMYRGFYVALCEAAAALNWAQVQLERKIDK